MMERVESCKIPIHIHLNPSKWARRIVVAIRTSKDKESGRITRTPTKVTAITSHTDAVATLAEEVAKANSTTD